jgi:hypothetical protein
MSDWGTGDTTANRIKQTYVKGFLDISGGPLIVQRTSSLQIIANDSNNPRVEFKPGDIFTVNTTGSFDVSYTALATLGLLGISFEKSTTDINSRIKYITTSKTGEINSTNIGNLITKSDLTVYGSTLLNGDASFNGKLYVSNPVFFASDLSLNGKLTTNSDISMNGNTRLGTGLQSVSINKDISAGIALDVSGSTVLRNTLLVGSDASFGTRLFVVGDSSLNGNLYVNRDLSVNGNLFVSRRSVFTLDVSMIGNLDVGSGTNSFAINKDISAGIALDVSGSTVLRNTLLVGSDASFGTRLFVVGDSSLNGNLYVNRDLSVNGNLFVSRRSVFTLDVSMNGNARLGTGGQSVSVNKDISAGIALDVSGSTVLRNTLLVGSDASFGTRLFVVGDSSLNGNLYVNRDLSVNENLFVSRRSVFTLDVSMNGNARFGTGGQSVSVNKDISAGIALDVSGSTLLRNTLLVGSDASFGTRLFVIGDSSLNGNLYVNRDLSVNGNLFVSRRSVFTLDVSMIGNLDVGSGTNSFAINKDISAGIALDVSGSTVLRNTLLVNSDASFGTRLFVVGDSSLNGNLYVNRDLSVNGNLIVSKRSVFTLDVSMNGNLDVGSGTNSFAINKDISAGIALDVSGSTVLRNTLLVGSDASFGTRLFVIGDSSINGNLSVGSLNNIQSSAIGTQMDIANNQTTGVLNIANNALRTGAINIGAQSSNGKDINIGGTASGGTTTIKGGALTLDSGSGNILNLGVNNTSGTINIGAVGSTSSSTPLNIATSSAATGPINIGNSGSAKTINIGGASTTIVLSGNLSVSNNTFKTIGIGLRQPPSNMTANVTNIPGHGAYYAYNSSPPSDGGIPYTVYDSLVSGFNTPYGFNTAIGDPSINVWSFGDTISDVSGTAYPGYRYHLDLPYQINLSSFSYTVSSAHKRFPVQGSMLGSNDGLNWNNIYNFDLSGTYNNTTANSINNVDFSYDSSYNRAFYSKYAFVVKSICGPGPGIQTRFMMIEIYLYGSNNILSAQGIGTTSIGVSENLTVGNTANIYGNLTVGYNTSMYTNNLAKLLIMEPSGSLASATTGSLVLQHSDASGASSVVFRSTNNAGSDYAYIQYQENFGGTSEKGLLTIGVENESGSGGNSDRISLYAAGGSGFVGVNTKDPLYNLDVSGTTNVGGTLTVPTITTISNAILNIANENGRTGNINIGAGTGERNIAIGSTGGGTITMSGGTAVINPTAFLSLGDNQGGISLTMGRDITTGTVGIANGSTSTGTTTIGRNGAITVVNSATTRVDISAGGILTLRGSSVNVFGDVSMNGNLDIGSGSSLVAINKDISAGIALDISGNLRVSGSTTLAGATYNGGTTPAYEINYPVNNGRIDFYTNNTGGVSTRGAKIDASGVYTTSIIDTIDDIAGTLNIGTAFARTGTIQIGGHTSTATKNINIGPTSGGGSTNTNIAGSVIKVGTSSTGGITIGPTTGGSVDIMSDSTAGSISIGQKGATSSSNTINIGSGSGQSGPINIGNAGTGTTTIGRNGAITVVNSATPTVDISATGLLTLRGSSVNIIGDVSMNKRLDAGGVYTTSIIDTIDNIAGTLNIGTASTRSGTINIGTGGGAGKAIFIGGGGGSGNTVTIEGGHITVGNTSGTSFLTLNPSAGATISLGTNMTGGSIHIGNPNSAIRTTSINIGNGDNNNGSISIGAGSGSKTINIGNGGTGTTTIGMNGAITVVNSGTTTVDISATGLLTLRGSSVNVIGDVSMNGNLRVSGTIVGTSFQPSTVTSAITFANNTTTGNVDIGFAQTTGNLNLGTGTGRSATGSINIGTGNTATNTINIGTGTTKTGDINIGSGSSVGSAFNISIGNKTTTGPNVSIGLWLYNGSNGKLEYQGSGSSIGSSGGTGPNSFANNTTTGDVNIGYFQTSGNLNVGIENRTHVNATSAGSINIGTGNATGVVGAVSEASGCVINIGTGSRNNFSSINIGTGNRDASSAINIGTGTSNSGNVNFLTGASNTGKLIVGGDVSFNGNLSVGSTVTVNKIDPLNTALQMDIATANTTANLNIGTGVRPNGTSVNINNNGGSSANTNIGGGSIIISGSGNLTLNTSYGTPTINIATGTRSGGIFNLGTGNASNGSILNIATGTRDATSTINIATNGSSEETLNIGTGNGRIGPINIGTGGTNSKAIIIGNNSLGTTYLSGQSLRIKDTGDGTFWAGRIPGDATTDGITIGLASAVNTNGSVRIMDGSGSTGTTTIGRNGAITVVNSATTKVDISATGLLTLRGSSVNVIGDVSMNANTRLGTGGQSVSVNKDISAGIALDVSGSTVLRNTLLVGSDASFGTRLFVVGDSSLNGNLYVNRDLSVNGNLYVSKRSVFTLDVSMIGNLDVGSGSSSVAINKDISAGIALDVSGTTVLRNSVAILKDISSAFALDVSGATKFRGAMDVVGNFTINGIAPVSSGSALTGNLQIGTNNGFVTINKPQFYADPSLIIYYNFDTSINGGLGIKNNATTSTLYDGIFNVTAGSTTGMIDTTLFNNGKQNNTSLASFKNDQTTNLNYGIRIGTVPVSSNMTFSFWIYKKSRPSTQGDWDRVFHFTDATSQTPLENNTIALDISASGFIFPVITKGAVSLITPSLPIVSYDLCTSVWNHVVWTINGTKSIIYINGSNAQTDTLSENITLNTSAQRNNCTIAYSYTSTTGATRDFSGNLDDFRYYNNKALNNAEIYQLYNNNFYTFDICGGFLANGSSVIYEPIGSMATANRGTLTLLHGDASGSSSIMFKSVNNPFDYGYIEYDENITGSTGFNYGLMTFGIESNGGSNTAQADRVSLFPSGGTGFVGVNTKTPLYSLDVSGTLNTNADASINGVSIGRGAGNVATNTVVGFQALSSNSTGAQNVAVGYQSLRLCNTTGQYNTAVGYNTLASITTGTNNVAIGVNAGGSNAQTATNNTFLGANTAMSQTTWISSTAVGYNAQITASNQIKLGTNAETVICGTNLMLQSPSDNHCYIRNMLANTNNYLYLGANNTNIVTVASTGITVLGVTTSTSFNANSDYRVKENVVPLDESFTIDGLNPVKYIFKSSGKQDIGFIAHEVQEFYPFLVSGEKDGKDTQSLNYNGFIGILTKEIQVLKKKVADQEARIVEQSAKALEQSAKALEQERKSAEQEARIQALEKMMMNE